MSTSGKSLELAVRQFRDSFFDVLASSRPLRRAAYRDLTRTDKFVYCRFHDHVIVVDPSDLVGRTLLENGNFDRKRTQLIAARARELGTGQTVLEVGANIGTQTIYFLKSGLFETVVCLEPDPRNVALLKLNLSLNTLSREARVVEAAAGSSPGTVTLSRDKGNSGGSNVRSGNVDSRTTDTVDVPLVTLDSLVDDGTLVPGDTGLIWIDAEGYEEEIFLGGETLFSRGIPLVFEFSPAFYDTGRANRIADWVYSRYSRVSLVDDDGFEAITKRQMLALKRQVDIFCSM